MMAGWHDETLTWWQNSPWTFVRNSEVVKLKLPLVIDRNRNMLVGGMEYPDDLHLIFYQVGPGPRQGGSFEKNKTTIGRRWPIGKLLTCRSNEVLKLWGPSTNEQIIVEMPMKCHESIHAQLLEWINEQMPMNRWVHEPMNRWISEPMKTMNQSINQSMNQRISKSTNQGINEAMSPWIHEPTNQRIDEPVTHWINEPTNQLHNETMNRWINKSLNQWINESAIFGRQLSQINARIRRNTDRSHNTKKYRVSRPRVFSPVKSHASELLRFPATWWWVVDMMMWLTWWCGC